jgi:hypothetical protein
MIPLARKNIFITKLLNRLTQHDGGTNIVRYVTFKAREPKGYFGVETAGGFSEKLEGKIIIRAWKEIPSKFPNCMLGDFTLKPDSFSGVLMMNKLISKEKLNKQYITILTYFKNRSTTLMNKLHGTHGRVFWENNYDEVCVSEIDKIRKVLSVFKKSA